MSTERDVFIFGDKSLATIKATSDAVANFGTKAKELSDAGNEIGTAVHVLNAVEGFSKIGGVCGALGAVAELASLFTKTPQQQILNDLNEIKNLISSLGAEIAEEINALQSEIQAQISGTALVHPIAELETTVNTINGYISALADCQSNPSDKVAKETLGDCISNLKKKSKTDWEVLYNEIYDLAVSSNTAVPYLKSASKNKDQDYLATSKMCAAIADYCNKVEYVYMFFTVKSNLDPKFEGKQSTKSEIDIAHTAAKNSFDKATKHHALEDLHREMNKILQECVDNCDSHIKDYTPTVGEANMVVSEVTKKWWWLDFYLFQIDGDPLLGSESRPQNRHTAFTNTNPMVEFGAHWVPATSERVLKRLGVKDSIELPVKIETAEDSNQINSPFPNTLSEWSNNLNAWQLADPKNLPPIYGGIWVMPEDADKVMWVSSGSSDTCSSYSAFGEYMGKSNMYDNTNDAVAQQDFHLWTWGRKNPTTSSSLPPSS